MNGSFTSIQCSARHHQLCATAATSTGPWTEEEDDSLRRAAAKCGTSSWAAIARLVPGRTRHQCRERWVAHLENKLPVTKDWPAEEDEKLLDAVKTLKEEYANISWRTVSMMLGGKKSEIEVPLLRIDVTDSSPSLVSGSIR
jgi:hypothetical protein